MRTKKMGVAGKFGPRYGRSITANYIQIQNLKKEKWLCPSCRKKSVKRLSSGIWSCAKCGHKFTGKAYKPA